MERLDDLERDGLKIFQNPEKFCFGVDAVLLSSFVKVKPGETAVDIGTGNGVIPILLTAKTEGSRFYGIEIQEDVGDMARRSVEYNHLEEKVEIIIGDVNDSSKWFKGGSIDVVTCNPPYMNGEQGLKNDADAQTIARHEVKCTLDDVLREGSRMLRDGGRYYMVHRPFRLADVIDLMRKNRLEPKRMRLVHPYAEKDANLVLIEATKDGGNFMVIEKPLIVYEKPGVYTKDVLKFYGR